MLRGHIQCACFEHSVQSLSSEYILQSDFDLQNMSVLLQTVQSCSRRIGTMFVISSGFETRKAVIG